MSTGSILNGIVFYSEIWASHVRAYIEVGFSEFFWSYSCIIEIYGELTEYTYSHIE